MSTQVTDIETMIHFPHRVLNLPPTALSMFTASEKVKKYVSTPQRLDYA